MLPLVRFLLPARQFLVKTFSGLELQDNEYFGPIYVKPARPRRLLHVTHQEMLRIAGGFLSKNWFNLATLVVAVIAVTSV